MLYCLGLVEFLDKSAKAMGWETVGVLAFTVVMFLVNYKIGGVISLGLIGGLGMSGYCLIGWKLLTSNYRYTSEKEEKDSFLLFYGIAMFVSVAIHILISAIIYFATKQGSK